MIAKTINVFLVSSLFFRFEWDKLLENVHCLIISVTKSDKQEAYILRWVLAVLGRSASPGCFRLFSRWDYTRNLLEDTVLECTWPCACLFLTSKTHFDWQLESDRLCLRLSECKKNTGSPVVVTQHRGMLMWSLVRCVTPAPVIVSLHSESSMFVSKRRFILKTCGTTLLLQALVPLLELAREYCGFDAIEVRHTRTYVWVYASLKKNKKSIGSHSSVLTALSPSHFQNFFYSRKNFMKPTHQEFPHRNFQEEVDFLSQIFPSMCRYVVFLWLFIKTAPGAVACQCRCFMQCGANSFPSASSRWRSLLYGTFELRLLVSIPLSSPALVFVGHTLIFLLVKLS